MRSRIAPSHCKRRPRNVTCINIGVGPGCFYGQRDAAASRAGIKYDRAPVHIETRQRRLRYFLGFRPRDEHVRRNGHPEPHEVRISEDILDGLALQPARQHLAEAHRRFRFDPLPGCYV